MPQVKVSVVIPVHNTGKYVDECAPSLLGQSLPADEYEVIYVDDGSTDDTLARLEKLAAAHAHVQVHTRPNSGWPGAPRNLGMAHAKGEYIQFVDHDDLLGPEALERLHAHARRNDADVVLGKMSSTMVRPRRLFRHTVDACTIENDELMQSLSPHKMFRRAFVEEHGLRFPEGPWILEDLAFVSAAYLKAKRIAVLADYPCYYWMKRDDGGNNTRHRFSPRHGFWPNCRTVVRGIKDGTTPSDDVDALQNRLLHRLYHVEVLSRAREPEILREDPAEQRERFEAARRLALEEFPTAVRDGLPTVSRLRAELLERGDFDSAVALAERVRRVKARSVVGGPRWQEGRLVADVTLDLLRGDGEPLVLVERGGKRWLDPEVTAGVPGTEGGWEVRDPFRLAYAELVVKDRDREDWWYPQGDLEVRLAPCGEGRSRLVASGRLLLDPERLAGGRPLERGVHDVWAYVQLLGIDRMVRLTGDGTPGAPAAGPALTGGRLALPYWTGSGQLALDVDQSRRRLGADTAGAAAANPGRGERSLPLPWVAATRDSGPAPLRVAVSALTVDAELVPGADGATAALRLPARLRVPSGRHPVRLPKTDAPVAYAVVRDGRLLRLEGPAHEAGRGRRLLDAVADHRQVRRVRRRLGR
ncbi:glycosyltransferase involved in cell wall biosynthesis [Streptomyces sp. SAI-133]|uniref:glycosyltransferase family 2 protein n=1 Tax=unclassified Streptomyces TaxID=2593676 RepID=UPI0024755A99|nr:MULTISPECIES: glycosyltransferase family A protein [unclassified Streptomyces]MDH6548907.1 glycosyltransferase involved in cell wall biosynthesis [Streptomyces sp. SAI-041]MDH6587076.1 glycosyltransferase involved in cell wall biosynthesis [Streptomyces sp. SAI-133]